MKIPGEGEVKVVRKIRVRRECENCGQPATKKHTYLMPNARINPSSSAYRHDDCTWCSDHELYLCDECDKKDCEPNIPEGYSWCSTFGLSERFAHMFLYWKEEAARG